MRLRLIGAGLIIAALIIALIALIYILGTLSAQDTEKTLIASAKTVDASTQALIAAHLQNVATAATGLFGALTTFLGTAIGAYFGIAAASSSNKAANTAVLQHAQMAQQLASQTQDDNAELRKQLVDIATGQGGSAGDHGSGGGAGDGTADSGGGQPTAGSSAAAGDAGFGPVLDPKDESGPGHSSAVSTPAADAGLGADVVPAGNGQ